MFLPTWAVWTGGFFAAIGVITTLALCPKLVGAIIEGILD